MIDWQGPEGRLGVWLADFSQKTLESYRVKPELVHEHDNLERSTVESGYGRKQLNELAQNAADAMDGTNGRVVFVLTDDVLYCANEGAPMLKGGLEALLMSHSSQKRDDKIGRFGLGFKSVLQITDRPEIISRTVSVRWERARSASQIAAIVPGRASYPVLRLAETFDPEEVSSKDDVLRELMTWATTVVRLPLRERTEWLDDEFKWFPHEFMLFANQITSLDLDNRRSEMRKTWTAERELHASGKGEHVVLRNGDQAQPWDVFRLPHRPTAKAMAEAGGIAAREELTVTWAVPLKQRNKGIGQLWSYFPTQETTTLRGIINATFKLNEDRQNMLAGMYNQEILERTLPHIVAFGLPDLVDVDDPGSLLDILPARPRPREALSWADEILNKPVMAAVAAVPFLPDLAGRLHPASDLSVEPAFKEEADKVRAMWRASVSEERPWAHRSLDATTARSATLDRLLALAGRERASVREWLEEVVHPRTNKAYLAALGMAAELSDRFSTEVQREIRSARIVPAGDGTLQPPIASSIFVPVDEDDSASNLVSLDFIRFQGAREVLRRLDIGLLDAQGQLKKSIAAVRGNRSDTQSLESFWTLSRSVDLPTVLQLLERLPARTVPVRCEDGIWRPINEVWLRGGLFPLQGTEDSALVVDRSFHAADVRLLKAIGIRVNLSDPIRHDKGALFEMWKEGIGSEIETKFQDKPAPVSRLHLKFPPAFGTPGLELLTSASPEVRRRATDVVLRQRHYEVSVSVNSQYVEPQKVVDPDVWWIRTYGAVRTSLGTVDVARAVASISGFPDGFLPVPHAPADSPELDLEKVLRLPTDPNSFGWPYIYALANTVLQLDQLHQLYGIAALRGFRKPQKVSVLTKHGRTELPLADAQVAADRRTYEYFTEFRQAAVLFVEQSDLRSALIDAWGLQEVAVHFESALKFEQTQSPVALMKRIPYISEAVKGLSKVTTIPCSELYIEHTNDAGDPPRRSERGVVFEDNTLYYKADLPVRVWLQHLLDETGKKVPAKDVLENAAAAEKRYEQDAKLRKIQAMQTDEEKLLALVGEDTIRNLIPSHVFELIDSRLKDVELNGTQLVKLASTLHGASLLQRVRPYLEAQGIETPHQFKGNTDAKKFVANLGISEDFAGQASDPKKPDREEVVGPIRLSPMHDYQSDVSKQIRALLAGQTRNRAIVQLPTGAGKTRVAVQSIVEHVGTVDHHSLVVWIAHTEELCEQAVDAWLYVWQGAGVPEQRMAISRMWDGRRPKPEETRLHVVVATIQTLSKIAEDQATDFNWLFGADILVVDEAHGAIAPSYTDVFRAFGRSNSERGKPLLGLSATPYRGVNEEETKRLVARFDGQLLMPAQFSTENAHSYLQDMGVLANVRHETLEGIELKLTAGVARPDGRDSAMLETRIDLNAVAKSQSRNDAILDHVISVAHDSTALVFAASVKHAEALAAALTAEGVRSAAISSHTSSADRRRQIEDFRSGKIRVLTNFDVLSQGFDAPKVGAVYVCRPTFAPNKYLQMIGRGLRGPKNGGSEEVLIVNVKDNIENFGHKLAFNHFEYLWNKDE
jgi:superfamily II DNA or RNA helicase